MDPGSQAEGQVEADLLGDGKDSTDFFARPLCSLTLALFFGLVYLLGFLLDLTFFVIYTLPNK
jgi:hypothetical protein